MNKRNIIACSMLLLLINKNVWSTELNIATVSNDHMLKMQQLTPEFEREHPGITLKWHVHNDGSIRMRTIADIVSESGNYDVVTIGLYEAPIWTKNNWLVPLEIDSRYDLDDLIPAIKDGLSDKGKLYAAPFYGESSILMYRHDLLKKAGLSFDVRPTWYQVLDAAKAMHDPSNGVYGICLRGKSGWGDNMALVSTIANSFGGRWFDMEWKPEINSDAWKKAVNFYVELLTSYGPPNSDKNSFSEILALSREGKCGMWVDASVAASFLKDASESEFTDKWAYTEAPYQVTTKGASWLWAWSLAIPKAAVNVDAAQKFIRWATSKNYIKLVAAKNGWSNIPTGNRHSTYKVSSYINAVGDLAKIESTALSNIDIINNTAKSSPYSAIQFVPIPEFVSIGGFTGLQITEALKGTITVEQALEKAQKIASRDMRRAGYYDK